jgi:N-formylglutamate amidohydrolase
VTVNEPFSIWEHSPPRSPVILSVPHAGRTYPEAFFQLSRLTAERVLPLEDRHADRLIELARPLGVSAIVQKTARAWIDLNRDEREFDPVLLPDLHPTGAHPSAKVRGGLGVIPRRIAHAGDIWRAPISAGDFNARLEQHYRPYHARLASLIAETRDTFGIAVVMDIHSMPALASAPHDRAPPRLVIGDLFGRAATGRFAMAAVEALSRSGHRVGLNSPYAGGHILYRHARPGDAIHGLQLEVDRTLYLDERGREPGPGLPLVQQAIATVIRVVEAEALAIATPIAAE